MLDKFIRLDINKLVPADWNYKKDDDNKMEKLKNNFKRNGQVENIIVRELETGYFEVVNGNHRLKAMQELGITEVMAYNCGKITKEEAVRLAIETNETKFESDQIILAQRIEEIKAEFTFDAVVETLPYTNQEMQFFHDLVVFDASLIGSGADDIIPEKTNVKTDNGWVIDFDSDEQKDFVKLFIETQRKELNMSQGEFVKRMVEFCETNGFCGDKSI